MLYIYTYIKSDNNEMKKNLLSYIIYICYVGYEEYPYPISETVSATVWQRGLLPLHMSYHNTLA